MKVNIVSKKLIKPSTPTPHNLKNYKISLIDEFTPAINVRLLLFYPPSSKEKRSNLEESLAKVLARFYVLAGRYIKKDRSVDCSDQGAEFVEAEAEDVDVELIGLVGKLKAEQLNDLFSRQLFFLEDEADPLLSIQVTQFKSCGGLVIGVSVFHKIFDASSLGTFISAWSNLRNPEGKITITPNFDSPSLFPARKNQDFAPHIDRSKNFDFNICVKRFLFTKEAINRLRSKLKPNDGKENSRGISRVRVVSALIAKALIRLDQAKHGKSRPCLIVQPVNMRERTIPPLTKHSCGNLWMLSFTRLMSETETKEMGIQELVYVQGDAIDKAIAGFAQILTLGEDGLKIIIRNLEAMAKGQLQSATAQVNAIGFSDWSKFAFYDADFGWGRPIWVSTGKLPGENVTVLMDNKDGGGIEALVHLKSNDMAYFEQDEDIKLFTIYHNNF